MLKLDQCGKAQSTRETIGYVAQRLMQVDVEGLVGAGHDERGEGRLTFRASPGMIVRSIRQSCRDICLGVRAMLARLA